MNVPAEPERAAGVAARLTAHAEPQQGRAFSEQANIYF